VLGRLRWAIRATAIVKGILAAGTELDGIIESAAPQPVCVDRKRSIPPPA